MTMQAKQVPYWNHEKLYQLFKYAIYAFLLGNVFLFMFEDYAASSHTYKNGISLSEMGNAFSASIDTVAWYALLVIFELETYALEDDQLSSKRKLALNAIAAVCYFFIVVAFLGYIEKATMIYAFEATSVSDLCAIVEQDISLALSLDDYVPLTLENCSTVAGQLYYQSNVMMYADQTAFGEISKIVLIDVVNAFTWLVVVIVLQIEVFLQLRGHLTSVMYKINSYVKGVAYIILFLCFLYWSFMGDVLGGWDAFLWLAAFIFIELNIFQWRQEEEDSEAAVS